MLRQETVSTPLARGFLLDETPRQRACIKCHFCGPETLFKVSDSSKGTHGNVCKVCDAARTKKRYQAKREQIRAAQRARYYSNLEESRRRGREYARSPRGLANNRAAVARYKAAHPERDKARYLVGLAVQRGDLVKPKTCQALGCKCAVVFAHHGNYARPLSVVWLCREHHEQVHHVAPIKLKVSAARKFARAPKQSAKPERRAA